MRLVTFFAILVMLLSSPSMADMKVLPSSLIIHAQQPEPINLMWLDPASAYGIASIHEPLGPYEQWEMPDYGKLRFGIKHEVQDDNDTIAQALLDFANQPVGDLKDTSVGDTDGNFTVINDTAVWF